MRVILLTTDHQRGGTPLRVAALARGLRAAGVDVHCGCLAEPGPVGVELDSLGIPTFACGARGPANLGALWTLAKHVRRISPDLIHSHLMHANVAARLIGLCLGVPVIGSTATIEVERRWHRSLERLTVGLDRAHVVHGASIAEHVRRSFGLPAARIHLLPPMLARPLELIPRAEARAAFGLAEDEFAVVWIGRFDPVKRLGLVIDCAELMNTAPCRFLLAGDGPTRAAIEARLGGSSARSRVRLLGWQEQAGPLLSAADVLLFPSLTEGVPNAVLEAMAAGLPVVASNIPPLRELSGDDNRLLLISGTDAGPYAAALMELQADPGRRQALAERAARWAESNLDAGKTVAALLAVYRDALTRPRG